MPVLQCATKKASPRKHTHGAGRRHSKYKAGGAQPPICEVSTPRPFAPHNKPVRWAGLALSTPFHRWVNGGSRKILPKISQPVSKSQHQSLVCTQPSPQWPHFMVCAPILDHHS